MKRSLILSILFVALFSTQAFAGDGTKKGVYISGGVGVSQPADPDVTVSAGSVVYDGELGLETGYLGNLAVGYNFGSFRSELELGYHEWGVKDITAFAINNPLNGDVDTFTVMINGYYDFHSKGSKFVPYIGAGLGFGNTNVKTISTLGATTLDDSASSLAYQLKAGLGYEINESLMITADYRYFGLTEVTLEPTAAGLYDTYETGVQSHDFSIGVRYQF